MNETLIIINQEESQEKKLARYQHNFNLLAERGVFEIRNGSAEIHFNSYGILSTIQKHEQVYRIGT